MKEIGFGTAAIGRPSYINVRQDGPAATDLDLFIKNGFAMLDHAYKSGIRYFDTAPGYGVAEQLMIEWAKNQNDESIEIATKWGYTYVADFDPNAEVHEIKEHSLAKLNEQWEQSKLLFPYLSTYQIHSATLDTGVLENKEIHARLHELKKEHGLKIGLTSSGDNQLEIIKKSLDVEVEGEDLFNVFQVTYNVLEQSLDELNDQLFARNKRVIVKEALANGRLFPNTNFPHYQPLYAVLGAISQRHNVGIDAIAIAYCNQKLRPYSVLSGGSEEYHLTDNLKAKGLVLAQDEMEALNSYKLPAKIYWSERKTLGWN